MTTNELDDGPMVRYSASLGKHLVRHPNGKGGWWMVVCGFCEEMIQKQRVESLEILLKKN